MTPGHVFPLVAHDGGVLVRSGRVEAAVDLARLAGLVPAGVICDVMNDAGSMASLDDLVALAIEHKLRIGSVRDLIAFRRRHDHLVECVADAAFTSIFGGEWRLNTFRNKVDGTENYAMVKGILDPSRPVLVRVHAASVFTDLLGAPGPRLFALQRAMRQIGEEANGVIVLLPFPLDEVRSADGKSGEADLRTYGIGAEILGDLGVQDMILLTNSPHRAVVGIEAYGLTIVEERQLREYPDATS